VTRPIALPVNVDGIPESMCVENRWVVWNYVVRDGRWTKVPYIATAPTLPANSTEPSTWCAFADALAAYEDGKSDGIGFVLGDGWIGFDADGTNASEEIRLLNTYAERSVGGSGIHAICHGVKPGLKCRVGPFELYERGRYFTVSGHLLAGTPTTVEERTAELAVLYARLFPDASTTTPLPDDNPARDGYAHAAEMEDEMLLSQMVGGVDEQSIKRWALYCGDISAYGSHSEADLALVTHLAWWTNYDTARIDRMFRQSGLMRDKWDREDYRRKTLAKALTSGTAPDATRATSLHGLHGLSGLWEL